jgi:dTDP-4-dehydrorhamnose reductase
MKVLILGANGCLGHQLVDYLSEIHTVKGLTRSEIGDIKYNHQPLWLKMRLFKPDWVINCIGAIKQKDYSRKDFIYINSLFPHQLVDMCQSWTKLIHISTDCVFSGNLKHHYSYTESDDTDALNDYGRSKALGEILDKENVITLRTSIIGRELNSRHGLFEWSLSNQGEIIKGFKNVLYSGLTTLALSKVIDDLITKDSISTGLWHVSSQPISKLDLLNEINDIFELNQTIQETPYPHINRKLNSSKFKLKTGYQPYSWDQMLEEYKEYLIF